jgi:glutaredoxin
MPLRFPSFLRRWFGRRDGRKPPAVLVLKTRTCPLCEEAVDLIRREKLRATFGLEIRDITDDAAAMRAHGLEVPVVFVDGVKRFFGRVDATLFRRLVDRG